VLTTLIAMLAAATPLPSEAPPRGGASVRIPADGRVVTPEGIRFHLPPRLAYSVHEADGVRAYVATSPDETTLVAVSAVLSDTELPCEAEQEGVELEAFRTTRGLRACRVAAADDSGLAFAIVLVKGGEVLVTVNAIGPASAAKALAASVAESVQVGASRAAALPRMRVPRAEPRMIGCFEQSTSLPMPSVGSFGRTGTERCFEEDFTFTQKTFLLSQAQHRDPQGDVEATSGAAGRAERRGIWHYEDGILRLRYEDGSEAEWEIQLGEGSLLADGKLWERL